jgi:hypothetical protein
MANNKAIRDAFFRRIRDQRAAMERQKPQAKPVTLENVAPPEQLWEFLTYVGYFLLEEGVVSQRDLDLAAGLIEDYEERVREVFGR